MQGQRYRTCQNMQSRPATHVNYSTGGMRPSWVEHGIVDTCNIECLIYNMCSQEIADGYFAGFTVVANLYVSGFSLACFMDLVGMCDSEWVGEKH